MTETNPLFSFTYAAQLLYWLIVYGLAGYAVKHIVEVAYLQRRVAAHAGTRVKPKRRQR